MRITQLIIRVAILPVEAVSHPDHPAEAEADFPAEEEAVAVATADKTILLEIITISGKIIVNVVNNN